MVKLTYSDDDGELDEVLIQVVIEDSEPPRVDCPAVVYGVAQDFESGPASPVATADDDCDPLPIIVNDRTAGGADATDLYPCGSTIVTFTATDASGNASDCATRVVITPEGSLSNVGSALRVRKRLDGSPELDWTLLGAIPPDSLFVVLRSDSPEATFPVAPAGGSLSEASWADSATGTQTWYYDVRSVLCDGSLSLD